jgi:Zn-dependent protease
VACFGVFIFTGSPLWAALAYSGFFLNLFNLAPIGFLDGGRIVTALSRWLWLPGFALLVWFGWKFPNFIIWLIILLSLPRIYSLFRKRTEEEQRYFEVTPSQRWIMSVLYFGLIAALLFGMHVAQQDLNNLGVRSHGHGRDVIVQ